MNDSPKKETLFNKITLFIQNVFLGKGDANYERKKLLKKILRDLNSLNPKIYDAKHNLVTSQFADFIFKLYRYTHPLRDIIDINRDKLTRNKIERFFVEKKINDQQKEMLSYFQKENIALLLKEKGVKELDHLINEMFQRYQKSFSVETIEQINLTFTNLTELNNLAQHDLYPFLRKFSSDLKENVISESPHFLAVESKYLLEDLKDIADVIYSIDLNRDFLTTFSIIGDYKGTQILSEKDVKSFLDLLKRIVSIHYLPLLIATIQGDPYFRPVQDQKTVPLFQNYFKNLSYTIKSRRDEIVKSFRDNKVDKLVNDLFGTNKIMTMKNYTDLQNEQFASLDVDQYFYVQALNYLRFFLMEKYNHYIRETINSTLLYGEMKNEEYHKVLADAYHGCNELMKKVLEFDQSLDDSSKRGTKIKNLIRTAAHEISSKKVLQDYLKGINNSAKAVVESSLIHFDQICSIIKLVIEDYNQGTKKVMPNIRKIGSEENNKLINLIVKSYNEISKLLVIIKAVSPPEIEKSN